MVSQFVNWSCPFYIVKKYIISPDGVPYFQYCIVTWRLQKALQCAIFSIGKLFWTVHYLRKSLPKGIPTPSKYLDVMAEVNNAIFKLSMLRVYWFHQDEILEIIDFSAAISRKYRESYLTSWKTRFLESAGKIIFGRWCYSYSYLTFSIVQNILGIFGTAERWKILDGIKPYQWTESIFSQFFYK